MVWGLGFGVWGLRFGFWGLGFGLDCGRWLVPKSRRDYQLQQHLLHFCL